MLILIDRYLTGRDNPEDPRTVYTEDGAAVCHWQPAKSSDWWDNPLKTPFDVMAAYTSRAKTRFYSDNPCRPGGT